jgi:hypothetical protein
MSTVRFAALLGLLAVAAAWPARAEEENLWPAYVAEKDVDGQTQSWDAAGPLVFSEATPAPEAGTAEGFRPFYVRVTGGGIVRTDILYPLFFIRKYPDSYKWSILQLINGEGIDHSVARAGGPTDKHFDIWPFYFSHYTKDPIDSYHALLPLYGTIKYRLGFSKSRPGSGTRPPTTTPFPSSATTTGPRMASGSGPSLTSIPARNTRSTSPTSGR